MELEVIPCELRMAIARHPRRFVELRKIRDENFGENHGTSLALCSRSITLNSRTGCLKVLVQFCKSFGI
jgi:hypothetical protein